MLLGPCRTTCLAAPVVLTARMRVCAVAVVVIVVVVASIFSFRVVRGRAALRVVVPPSMLIVRGWQIVVLVVLVGTLRRQYLRKTKMMSVDW